MAATEGDHEIKVRIKGRDNLKVRHRRGYRDKGAEERLNDRLFTSLFLGLSENPLEARLGAGAMTPVNEKTIRSAAPHPRSRGEAHFHASAGRLPGWSHSGSGSEGS